MTKTSQALSRLASLERLLRRVVLERIVTRLEHAQPGRWVLKGGMALDVRLAERARLTKVIDLHLISNPEG